MTRRVGIIGFGAIAQDVVALLRAEDAAAEIAVLVRPGREAAAREVLSAVGLPDGALITADLDTLLATSPSVIAECAGHGAVEAYGETILRAGPTLVVASVGALADAALYARLAAAGGQLVVPSGAIGGIDVLAAARRGGLRAVTYTGRKPPQAWAGTPADQAHDLSALTAPLVIFEGNAREAARLYPKNANVAATLALAGLGMEATQVTLIADPSEQENIHEFSILSDAVDATVRLVGKPSSRNPKTSQTTALSVARAVLNRDAAIVI